jgi:DNA-directed RNA polymerase beta' subunit
MAISQATTSRNMRFTAYSTSQGTESTLRHHACKYSVRMQTYEAQAELRELMLVSRNIVSPQSNKPVMKIVQDSLLAARLMTRRDTFITRPDFMGLCMQLRDWDGVVPPPAILKPVPLWTGKQVLSS